MMIFHVTNVSFVGVIVEVEHCFCCCFGGLFLGSRVDAVVAAAAALNCYAMSFSVDVGCGGGGNDRYGGEVY